MEWTEHFINGVIILLTLYMLVRAVLRHYFPPDMQ